MDLTAITLCMDHKLPLIVLNFWDDHSLMDAVLGKPVGTLIDGDKRRSATSQTGAGLVWFAAFIPASRLLVSGRWRIGIGSPAGR
jgi:hypothetical protein